MSDSTTGRTETLDDWLEQWRRDPWHPRLGEVQALVDEIGTLRLQVDAGRLLLGAVAPFVEYFRASSMSRQPTLPDSIGVATHSNSHEGDTAITVGDLRHLARIVGEASRALSGKEG